MNKAETARILATFREAYPNGAEITESTVNLWATILAPYEYAEAWQGAVELIGEWDGFTMPPPAALVKKLDAKNTDRFADLREEADRLLRRGSTLTWDDFWASSPEIQEHFGSVARLKRIAQMPAEQADRELDRFEKELPGITRKLKQYSLEGGKDPLLESGKE